MEDARNQQVTESSTQMVRTALKVFGPRPTDCGPRRAYFPIANRCRSPRTYIVFPASAGVWIEVDEERLLVCRVAEIPGVLEEVHERADELSPPAAP